MNNNLAKDLFIKNSEAKKLSHAFLLFGGEREEKFSFVKSFANFLEKGNFTEPENPLSEMLIIEKLEDKEEVGIDLVRQIKNFLFQTPSLSSKRVVIVREAEKLTPHAQNAILKIVEEPPESALIFFIADTEHGILPTLLSRLQRIYFDGKIGEKEDSVKDFIWKIPDRPISEEETEKLLKELIVDLKQDNIKNSAAIKEVLKTLRAVKELNTNKKLQLKALMSKIGKKESPKSAKPKKIVRKKTI